MGVGSGKKIPPSDSIATDRRRKAAGRAGAAPVPVSTGEIAAEAAAGQAQAETAAQQAREQAVAAEKQMTQMRREREVFGEVVGRRGQRLDARRVVQPLVWIRPPEHEIAVPVFAREAGVLPAEQVLHVPVVRPGGAPAL